MSVLPILKWPDPVLKARCARVEEPLTVDRLVSDMFETMYDAPGRGLAAPQVGVELRLFVMDAGWKEGDMTPLACLNPEIEPLGETQETGTEACLSMPGVEVRVTRPLRVRLRYTDLAGERQTVELTGAAARVAQHELDHLDGRMHLDRIAEAERDAALAAWEEQT